MVIKTWITKAVEAAESHKELRIMWTECSKGRLRLQHLVENWVFDRNWLQTL